MNLNCIGFIGCHLRSCKKLALFGLCLFVPSIYVTIVNACLYNKISLFAGSQEHYICLFLFSQIDERSKSYSYIFFLIYCSFWVAIQIESISTLQFNSILNSILQHFRKWKLHFPWVILWITKCPSSKRAYCIHKSNTAQCRC